LARRRSFSKSLRLGTGISTGLIRLPLLGSMPEDFLRQAFFPGDARPRKLQGLDWRGKDVALFEALQPYNRADGATNDPLVILRKTEPLNAVKSGLKGVRPASQSA